MNYWNVKPSFSSSFTLNSLPQSFSTFFSDKIQKLRSSIVSAWHHHFLTASASSFKPPELPYFLLAIIDEFCVLLHSSPDTSCDLDPTPTSLLKQCKSVLPKKSQNNILNLSLSTVVFQTNLETVLFILFSKNPTLTKKTYPTTCQYLTYLTYPNSQNDLLKPDSLIIWMKTISQTQDFKSTLDLTLLTPLYLLYTKTVSEPWVNSKSLVGVFLIFLLALTPLYHSILLHRFRYWFGFTETVLSWIQSYLSSMFVIMCRNKLT